MQQRIRRIEKNRAESFRHAVILWMMELGHRATLVLRKYDLACTAADDLCRILPRRVARVYHNHLAGDNGRSHPVH